MHRIAAGLPFRGGALPTSELSLPILPRTLPVSLPAAHAPAIPAAAPRAAPSNSTGNAEQLFQRGATAAAMGLLDIALEDFRALTRIEPAQPRNWRALAAVLRRLGNRAAARDAEQHAATLAPQPPRPAKPVPSLKIEKSTRRLRERIAKTAWRDPADLLREHLLEDPTDPAALRLLANLEMHQGDLPTARALLERAIDQNPAFLEAREEIAGLLLRMRQEAEALPHIDQMLAQKPFSTEYRRYKIAALSAIGDYAEAARLSETLAADNRRPNFWLNYARALRFSGQRVAAIDAYRKCIELDPAMGEAYWGLSYVQKQPLSNADLDAIRAQLETGTPTPVNRFHFHYALGNALEKQQAYAESFAHYAEGARACRLANEQEGDIYSAREHTALIGRLKMAVSPERLALAATPRAPTPIFIVGMPRSGSTLLEQILSAHSHVEATQELPDIDRIADEITQEAAASGSTYPEFVADLGADELGRLAQIYLDRTRIYRKTEKPFFVDKMPFNWEKAGLIHLMFPNAKIIDARRHPVACCFSAFKQLIARGAGYTCDLHDIGLYYRDYLDFMAHIDRVLPGRVHRVIYERMVDDTESEIRRLLEYCGLLFEPACLQFWASSRSVATPSVEQVRQPIFRDALDQWRHYDPWLAPLVASLGDAPAIYAA